MKFISIFTHEPSNRDPTEAEMGAMGKLVEDVMTEGWLLATEGVTDPVNFERIVGRPPR